MADSISLHRKLDTGEPLTVEDFIEWAKRREKLCGSHQDFYHQVRMYHELAAILTTLLPSPKE